MSIPFTDNPVMLNATTVDKTSDAWDVSKRQQITIVFLCASHSSGNGVFTVDASNDGTNWVTGIAVHNATQTTATTDVTSVTLSADGTAGVYVRPGWRFIRVAVDVTTDGAYSAIMENGG